MDILNIIAISLILKPPLMMNMMQIKRSTSLKVERSVPLRLRNFTGFSTANENRLYARINHDDGANVFVWFLWTGKTQFSLLFPRGCLSTTTTQHFLTSCSPTLGIALPFAKSPCCPWWPNHWLGIRRSIWVIGHSQRSMAHPSFLNMRW